MANERKYFDADKLIQRIYNKIALWHNNDERLNDSEMGRELKFLSKEIAEDVLTSVFGATEIKVDKTALKDPSNEKGAEENTTSEESPKENDPVESD